MVRFRCTGSIAVSLLLTVLLAPGGQARAADEARWFAVPIEVAGLPPSAEGVPVGCDIDFGAMLAPLKVTGIVDERSLRLVADGRTEVPSQYLPVEHARPKQQRLMQGTRPSVTFVAEYAAGESPPGVRQKGTLTWLARADEKGTARYELRFAVPQQGRMVQVPFPPENFRHFDAEGRAAGPRFFPSLQIRPQWPLEGVVHVHDANRPVTTYHFGPRADEAKQGPAGIRRPFLYPVIGPDGWPLTEFGKPHDPTGSHAHHYSLWIAHSSVAGRDFWSEKGGAIAHAGIELLEDGPVFCRIVQKTKWIAEGKEYLQDRRAWTVYCAGDGFRLIDLDLEVAPAGAEPVELGKTTFGFLAVRVAQSMTVFDGGGEIVNAQGRRNEQAAHLERAAWIDQSGPVAPGEQGAKEGAPPPAKWNGIAMFDHPVNPNHPTVWHCRNDGWAGASVCAEGPRTLKPGEPLRLQYRILLHRGNAVEGRVAQRYAEYASRPVVRMGEAHEARP